MRKKGKAMPVMMIFFLSMTSTMIGSMLTISISVSLMMVDMETTTSMRTLEKTEVTCLLGRLSSSVNRTDVNCLCEGY